MSRQIEGFQPTEDVTEILEGLQEAGYGWIAEEIRSAILEGRTLGEEPTEPILWGGRWGTRRKAGSHVTVPLTATEQLRLALLAILRYTVELYDTWVAAIENLRRLTKDPQLRVIVTAPESDDPIPMFADDYALRLPEIIAWVRQFWPGEQHELESMLPDAIRGGRR